MNPVRENEAEHQKKQKRKTTRAERRMKRSLLILAAVLFCVFLAGLFAYLRFEKAEKGHHGPLWLPFESSKGMAVSCPELIPDYDGKDTVILADNRPLFTLRDLDTLKGEQYAELDLLGRCGPAAALLDRSMMPRKERGYIGMIEPSGWEQAKYPGLVDSDPPYLYNRCHLISYALTGQNANERNLITGTRHMNADGMLPYEIAVIQYLEKTGNHVLYRVTPYFRGRELLARGVEMEAYSVEDEGKGLHFHVFVYNCQPGVEIDYQTGGSFRAE